MRSVVAMILAGGQGAGLGVLTRHRPASAVPFGGRYRVIDFTLSNCVNSDISRVAVLTQYAPLSLNEHIKNGRAWDLDRRHGGVRLLQAYARREGVRWYRGTADAIAQNLNLIDNWGPRWVLVLSGDQVYKMDYTQLIQRHQESGCAVTMTVKEVPLGECHRFGIVGVDERDRLLNFEEKPKTPRSTLANLGIYVFDSELLLDRLGGAPVSDVVEDLILPLLADGAPIQCHRFAGYWDDIGTVDSYFRSNMELLAPSPRLNLADAEWPIYSPSDDHPPFRCGRRARVRRSLVADGAVVHGEVEDSVLFPDVVVERGAVIRSSIALPGVSIGEGAQLDLVILDKGVQVGRGAVIGYDDGSAPRLTARSNLVTVGKGARIPDGCRIGRRCVIDVGADFGDFQAPELVSGSTVVATGS